MYHHILWVIKFTAVLRYFRPQARLNVTLLIKDCYLTRSCMYAKLYTIN